MASATKILYVLGQITQEPEARGVRGLRRHSEYLTVADAEIKVILPPLTVVSVAPCLPGHGPASLGRRISPVYDGSHASDRTSLNSCRTFRPESPASVLMNNWP